MGLRDTLSHIFRRNRREASREAPVSSAPRLGYSYSELYTPAPPALTIATVYRCVKLLSDSVAQLPLHYMRLREGIFVPNTTDPLYYLLTVQPDIGLNAFEYWSQVVVDILLDGNSYIVPIYDPVTLQVSRLARCSRGTVNHDTSADTYIINDPDNGICGTYQESEVIHLKGLSWKNPKSGVGVISHARLTIETAGAGDAETKKRFLTGGNIRAIVGNDRAVKGFGEYQDQELGKTAENLDERLNGNHENIVAVPGMVSLTQLSMSSVDLQFLETRKFTVREICRFFGVHPSFVFDDTSNNYKSAEMANVAFLSNTLNPILRKIEVELLRKLVPPSLAMKRRFSFDRRELMACDLSSRVQYQSQTIAAGLYTINEWRASENKPPVEGGDKVLVSANLRTVDEIMQGGTAVRT